MTETSVIETRKKVEERIYERLRAEHYDLFWQPNADWAKTTGRTDYLRDSDSSYIYALADYIAGGRKSSPSTYAYNVKSNGATGRERLKIIQRIGREVRRAMEVPA